jgi:hypothetical protein
MIKKAKKKPEPCNEAERVAQMIDSVPMSAKAKEEIKKTLTPTIIQFLLRWETGRDLEIEDRVISIVMEKMQEIYLADNENICKNVADCVGKQLAEVLAPWNERLGNIEKVLDRVADWQKSVDDLHIKMDKRVEDLEKSVYMEHHRRLTALEKYASPKKTIQRMFIAGVIGLSITAILFFSILNNKMADVERMLKEHIKIEKTE